MVRVFVVCFALMCAVLLSGCGKDGNENTAVDGAAEPLPREAVGDPDADDDGDGLTNGLEAKLGTDPGKADSDGDGYDDGQEVNDLNFDPSVNPYKFNPLIADVPKLELEVVGMPKVYISQTRADGKSLTVDNSTSATTSGSTTTSSTMSESSRSEVSATVGFESTASVGTNSGASSTVRGSVTGTLGSEESKSWTDTQTNENSETLSESRGFGSSQEIVQSGAEVEVTVNVYNRGHIPFTLQTVSLNVVKSNPGDEVLNLGHLEPRGKSTYFARGTLSGGKGIEGMIFEADGLTLEKAEKLLAPGTFIIRTSNSELLDVDQRSFKHRFLAIDALTARVIIDYGMQAESESYLVSCVTDPAGRTLSSILADALYIPYETGDALWKFDDRVGRTMPGLLRLRDVATDSRQGGYWIVTIESFDGREQHVQSYHPLRDTLDLDAVRIKPGMVVTFAYVKDEDRDGLGERTEFMIGTDPLNADTDGDGMPDGQEVREDRDPLYDDRNKRPALVRPSLSALDRIVSFNVTLTDPENDPAHQLVIEWGDGKRTVLDEPHNGPIQVQHLYAKVGTYNVTATPYATPRHAGDTFSQAITTQAAFAVGWSTLPPSAGWGITQADASPDGDIYVGARLKDKSLSVARIAPDGAVKWHQTIDVKGREDTIAKIIARPSGGVYVILKDDWKDRMLQVAYIDAAGKKQWVRGITGMRIRDVWSATIGPDEAIYLGVACYNPPKPLFKLPKGDDWLQCVIKLTADASPVWTARMQAKSGGSEHFPRVLSVTPDGMVYAAGRRLRSTTSRTPLLVAAFSANGHLKWSAAAGAQNASQVFGIQGLADGKVILGFNVNVQEGGSSVGLGGAFECFAADGSRLWKKEMSTDRPHGYGTMDMNQDGMVLCYGFTFSKNEAGEAMMLPVMCVVTPDGTVIDGISLPVRGSLMPLAVALLPDGSVFVAGSTNKSQEPKRYRLDQAQVVFTLFNAN